MDFKAEILEFQKWRTLLSITICNMHWCCYATPTWVLLCQSDSAEDRAPFFLEKLGKVAIGSIPHKLGAPFWRMRHNILQ